MEISFLDLLPDEIFTHIIFRYLLKHDIFNLAILTNLKDRDLLWKSNIYTTIHYKKDPHQTWFEFYQKFMNSKFIIAVYDKGIIVDHAFLCM